MSLGPFLVGGAHKVSRFLQFPCTAGEEGRPGGEAQTAPGRGRGTCFGSPALLPGWPAAVLCACLWSCFPGSGPRPGTHRAGVAVSLRPTCCVDGFVDGVLGRALFWKNPGWWAGRGEEGVWLQRVGEGGHSPQRR